MKGARRTVARKGENEENMNICADGSLVSLTLCVCVFFLYFFFSFFGALSLVLSCAAFQLYTYTNTLSLSFVNFFHLFSGEYEPNFFSFSRRRCCSRRPMNEVYTPEKHQQSVTLNKFHYYCSIFWVLFCLRLEFRQKILL